MQFESYLITSFLSAMSMSSIGVVKVRPNEHDSEKTHVLFMQHFSGPAQGVVILSLPRETALYWASHMLNGVDVFRVDAWFTKALSEICHFVTKRALDDAGLKAAVVEPTLVYHGEMIPPVKANTTYRITIEHNREFDLSIVYS